MIEPPQHPPRASFAGLARTIGLALKFAWRSGRRELTTILLLTLVQAAGLAVVLLLSQRLVEDVIAGENVVGAAALVTGVGAVLAFCSSVANEQQQMLTERCERHARSRVHAVATAVDLVAFDDPDVPRPAPARVDGDDADSAGRVLADRPDAVARWRAGCAGGVARAGAAARALGLLAVLPAALATSQRGRAYYRFAFGQTARDRERHYLSHLLVTRESAAEVRAFELAGFLRERHDALADERITELRAGRPARAALGAAGRLS